MTASHGGQNAAKIEGQRFGRLVVIARAPSQRQPSGRMLSMWTVRCDCGTEKIVGGVYLRRGTTVSCGCRKGETVAEIGDAKRTHGESGTAGEYKSWRGMINRCCNPKYRAWNYYGGRGITVCDRWRHDYEAFLADMGRKPSPKHSIDRIDNNGNYEPANCRWATQSEQNLNQRPRRRRLGSNCGVAP